MSLSYYKNNYIDYLNSLHSISASGSNALAESQALSKYFPEIYQPFPIISELLELLKSKDNKVIILTGHAGDGKSTVVLDIYKKLKKIPVDQPLKTSLKERELIEDGRISLIKDMSELSLKQRMEYLIDAFSEKPDNWLIVSNTGPLLDSIQAYAKHINLADEEIESDILRILNLPYDNKITQEHSLSYFGKELVIVNLTKLDNVQLGADLLKKLVIHSGWNDCSKCHLEKKCPIKLNHIALTESIDVVSERVRYVYLRLSQYESRLTLRQIVAQLSYSITGGKSCRTYQKLSNTDNKKEFLREYENILFSDTFFGFRAGKESIKAKSLQAIYLLNKADYGRPSGPEFERGLNNNLLFGWAEISESLGDLVDSWKSKIGESESIRTRASLRRLVYMFGNKNPASSDKAIKFINFFLDSKVLLSFDEWRKAKSITIRSTAKKRFKDSCLKVLLEEFTGFSANQFKDPDKLYLTLKRPDSSVVQPSQLILESITMREFDLNFNIPTVSPVLNFRNGAVILVLSLPLVDYIFMRRDGEISSSLSPIHKGQIDWFKSELLRVTESERKVVEELEILRSGIDGEVQVCRFIIDTKSNILELD